MLYCPKCRRTYEEGTRRFCENDGGRLLPAPTGQQPDSPTGGVFSNLIGKTHSPDSADKKNGSAPRFIPLNKTEESGKKLTSFPSAGRIFQSEQFLKPKKEEADEAEDSILELDPLPKNEQAKPLLEFEPVLKTVETEPETGEAPKPAPRLIRPNEIASGTANIGNRKTNPLGRPALSWENPEALLGQTVKGRYQIITEVAGDDEESLIYLAEDKIVAGKKVVVRVFMNDGFGAPDFEEKIYAEERVSLSHLNHPNIASVFDSGELPEGNEFIVSEFVEGESIAEILAQHGEFNALRTARIVRQTSYALSEAHQNGILHRNLKPENIMLTISEAGIEQVKLMNFGVSHGEITDANLPYKAPEEIEKGNSTYASDIYALGVIAYQMLTTRLPFPTDTDNALLKAQKNGLTVLPTSRRAELAPLADKILQKALAFHPAERYPKARDFGDAFFNALTTAAPWTEETATEKQDAFAKPEAVKKTEATEKAQAVERPEPAEKTREFFAVPSINEKDAAEEAVLDADLHISPSANKTDAELAAGKTNNAPAWEKRSPAPPKTGNLRIGALAILGAVLLIVGVWGVSRSLLNRPANQPASIPDQNSANQTPFIPAETAQNNLFPPVDADLAPPPRLQTTPPGAQRFQNVRENLNESLAKNFLGFEVFYPQYWKRSETPTNFLDVAHTAANGFPIEQMIVTRYESRGTMTLDRPNFPKLVEKSNQDLKKYFGESYEVVAEGETTIQNGRWKVYEVKFQGAAVAENGEKVAVFGRRFWLPVQRAGVQNGFVVTLLATSLSDAVKSVEDVGVQGELANVLATFEPEQLR